METDERRMSGPLAEVVAWIGAGTALGTVYLWLIRRTVAAIGPPAAKTAATAYLVLRLVLAMGAFWMAASHGALPLLMMLVGFLVARTVAIRRSGKVGGG
jgi:F1F0 ATPase subunit 2